MQSLGECRLCELWDQWKEYLFRKLSPPKERPTVNSMSAELWYSTTTPKNWSAAMGWHQVMKRINGRSYLYLQMTYRDGGKVKTKNKYLGLN